MSGIGTTDNGGRKSLFTSKNVLKVLWVCCIIFVFCPSFLVSCSGENMDVSVMTAVGGLSAYGETVVEPQPVMLICLLIPVIALALLFVRKFTDKKTASIILIGTVGDLIIWCAFRTAVKKLAEDNYCSFKTTGWYVINIIVLVIIALLTALIVTCKLGMETDLAAALTGGGTQGALNHMSAAMSQMSSTVTQIAGNVAGNMGNKPQKVDVIGFCSKCGNPIEYGCKFCIACGTPVPESMLAEAEAAKRAAEEAARKAEEEAAKKAAEAARKEAEEQVPKEKFERPMFCQQCGAKLKPDAMFCESCGKKIE